MDCLLCGSESDFTGMRAVISPWIRKLSVTSKRSSRLLHCGVCDFSFFSVKYNDRGMQNLYADYRGSKYQRLREQWESWNSRGYTERHSKSEVLQSRVGAISSFLSKDLILEKTHLIDVGGDTG